VRGLQELRRERLFSQQQGPVREAPDGAGR